jgi:hypothetical protein
VLFYSGSNTTAALWHALDFIGRPSNRQPAPKAEAAAKCIRMPGIWNMLGTFMLWASSCASGGEL